MRKVMMFLVVLALALSVSAEDNGIKLNIPKGSDVGTVYYAHNECWVAGYLLYSKEYRESWQTLNQVKDFNQVQPGEYLFPTCIGVTNTEVTEVETTQSATPVVEMENGIQEEDFIPRHEIILTNYDELTTEDWARISDDMRNTRYVAKLEGEIETLTMRYKITAAALNSSEKQNKKLSAKLPPDQVFNHSDPDHTDDTYIQSSNSSKSIIPIIPISTAFVIGSVVIIISLIIFIGFLLYKVSQQKCDRLRLENNLEHIPRQMEADFAKRIKHITDGSNKHRKNALHMRHLLERDNFFFHYPGTVVKATRQPLEDIILPIEDRQPNGFALVRIPGIEELVPARPRLIEAALRSAAHQSSNKALILPVLPELEEQVQQTEQEKVIEKPQITHSPSRGITAAAS